jgi:hypothetical protein
LRITPRDLREKIEIMFSRGLRTRVMIFAGRVWQKYAALPSDRDPRGPEECRDRSYARRR